MGRVQGLSSTDRLLQDSCGDGKHSTGIRSVIFCNSCAWWQVAGGREGSHGMSNRWGAHLKMVS